jgi:poly(beta-D-mannuronate) lyase
MKRQTTLSIVALATALGTTGAQAQSSQGANDACFEVPEPVVSLSYGSRYTDESEDRSDIDEQSNAEVNEALDPVDEFIVELTSHANAALESEGAEAEAEARCVIAALDQWAQGDALSELGSMNANLSVPSRVAGLAMAYWQASRVVEPDPERGERIDGWLRERMTHSMNWFDGEAPPKASRNNLRAWAGFAAAAVGETTNDDLLRSWGAYSLLTVACQADEAGALPLEMARGPRAMHYQLHAVAPLVVGATLLDDDGYDLFSQCDGAINRVAGFVPAAFEDEALVTDRAGEAQTLFNGEDEVQGFELAWAEAYLSLFDAPEVEAFVESYRPLGNSKLGGSQSVLW